MEHLSPKELGLDIQQAEAHLVINGLVRIFTTEDSAYWLYPPKYKMFNHIVKWSKDSTEYIFSPDEGDLDLLHDAGITQICAAYPNQDVINIFWELEMADYENDLEGYDQTGKI